MPTVRRNGPGWQAIIRRKGCKTVSKNFPCEDAARAWAQEMDLRTIASVERQRRFVGIDEEIIIPASEWAPILWKRVNRNGRERAKSRGLGFDLTKSAFDAIVVRCGNRCEVTGIPFNRWSPPLPPTKSRFPFYPSIDRINSKLGYMEGNVRIVCHIANLAMNHWGMEALESFLGGANFYGTFFRQAATSETR